MPSAIRSASLRSRRGCWSGPTRASSARAPSSPPRTRSASPRSTSDWRRSAPERYADEILRRFGPIPPAATPNIERIRLQTDILLDAAPTPAAIDAALAKLEALARERGSAVGAVTALPVSIDRISQWAKAAESRGLTLVPISAIAAKPKSS